MEEDGGVKAPATRLRGRLSAELSEESKSPAGLSTPTKKRGGRLAAKPQLELIDENTPQNSPKKITRRRSTARDLAEMDEKTLTPSRRSSRIKSNTSILYDTPQAAVDSPRALRALRRTSQVGSDTETLTPVTPARTRRGRKDSTTSLDKQATAISASGTPVTPARIRRTRKDSESSGDKPADNEEASRAALIINEVITEEPENNLRKSVTSGDSPIEKKMNGSPNSPRKSPRLLSKENRNSKLKNEQNESINKETDVNMNISAGKYKLDNRKSETCDIQSALESKQKDVVDGISQSKLSLSSGNILNSLDEKHNKMNKSTSSLLQIPNVIKNKRHRTKSLTTLSSISSKEGNFCSDNEITKKKIKNNAKTFNMRLSSQPGSGDSALTKNDIEKSNMSLKIQGENDAEKYLKPSMKEKKHIQNQTSESDKIMKETILDQSKIVNKSSVQSPKPSKDNLEGNKENLDDQLSKNTAEFLFQKAPIQSILFIEDSDSNTESLGKTIKHAETESEDQLVPEVNQVKHDENPKKLESNILNLSTERQLFTSLPTTANDTCEPMDIDETMPESVSLTECENKSVNKSKNKSLQKSSLYSSHDVGANKSVNTSKRKLSLSNSVSSPDYEKTDNGNKSTLILSQIKDLSTSNQGTSKILNDSRQINEQLSKSLKEPDTTKKVSYTNISVSCLTSTPVQQKDDKKLPMHMNTSAITPHNESKKVVTEKNKSISMVSKSSQSGSSDEVSDDDNEHNSLVVDEAESAGDEYESGDSQIEEERQYERDHEILDKGETLTSEDEVSNDSDYEKDSFVVSSDEVDNELLSGSEDLDMSDNELTMSAKSKKKYNERLSKQQKKASREMFQARHSLDKSDQSSRSKVPKNNKTRLDSKLLESGDDAVVPPKKKKRMRLESLMDSSSAKSDGEESKPESTENVEKKVVKKKESKRLPESMSECRNEIDVPISTDQHFVQDKSVSEEIGYKKKKSKRLSESISNESVMNEKEITAICDTTIADNPLQLQIKQEPITPQRDLDISTVHFTVREEIEHVQVSGSVSIIKGNETSDPLLASMTQEENNENSDDNSSISENEEITKNYDSMLNKLNKKTRQDISLNLNKKEKRKAKLPVIDQLNITQTKKIKSKRKSEITEPKSIFKKTSISDDDANSDSIDLKLLFSDESNDSAKESLALQNRIDTEEKSIPLKRTEGKTNLLTSLNASQIQANDTSFNTSIKKKNKRQSNHKENTADASQIQANDTSFNTSIKKKNKRQSNHKENTADETDGQTLPFFIDTVGSRDEPLSNSASTKTKKNKTNSITVYGDCDVGIEVTDNCKDEESNDVALAEVSNTSLKIRKKSKKFSISVENDATNNESTKTNAMLTNHVSINKTPGSEKKKKKADEDGKSDKELSVTETHNKLGDDQKAAIETSSMVSDKRENKKRKRLSSAKDEVEDVILQGDGLSANTQNQMKETLVSNTKKKRKLVQNSEDNAGQSRKRKEREDDIHDKKSKVLKQNSPEKKNVPRLPTTILKQLEDKPMRQFIETNLPKVVSTTQFKVEETRKRRNKPSGFLEESIYWYSGSEIPDVKKQKPKVKKPTVLPFTPTASISDSGFTTKFHITPLPQTIEFLAQRNEATNFKTDYLNARRPKKLRTYELNKNYRSVKLSKYY